MSTIGKYLQTWNLNLSTTETLSAVFHLNNKEAKRELEINFNDETLSFFTEPKYFGITLDRTLTYRRHLESLRKKLTSRIAPLRRLAGSGLGAGATTLREATLPVVHSTTAYCVPVRCRSAHTRHFYPFTNDTLQAVIRHMCVLHQRTIFPSLQASNLLNFPAKESHCLQIAVLWSLDTCSTQRSPVQWVGIHGIPKQDPHLYPLHNASVHRKKTTEVQRTERITDGMRSGWRALQHSVLSSPISAPTFPERPSK